MNMNIPGFAGVPGIPANPAGAPHIPAGVPHIPNPPPAPSVRSTLVLCGVPDVGLFDGKTPAQRMASDIFFTQICKGKFEKVRKTKLVPAANHH